jgi:hypothetical protein
LSLYCTDRWGYFFSPKGDLENAKHVWNTGSYDLEKFVKVLTRYYEKWNSETISPKGLHSLMNSPELNIIYDNFKESKIAFDEY